MPLPLFAETAEVILQGRQDGQETINTLWFTKAGGAITPTDIQGLGTTLGNWYSSVIAPFLADTWQAEVVTAIDRSVGFGAMYKASLGPTPGGVATESAPNNVAACVSFSAAAVGRNSRGRNYVPAVPNAAITLNTLDGAFIANIIGAYQQLLPGGAEDPSPFVWVVASSRLNNEQRPVGVVSPVASVVFTSPYVRSMRTREVGKGK